MHPVAVSSAQSEQAVETYENTVQGVRVGDPAFMKDPVDKGCPVCVVFCDK